MKLGSLLSTATSFSTARKEVLAAYEYYCESLHLIWLLVRYILLTPEEVSIDIAKGVGYTEPQDTPPAEEVMH